MVESRSDVSANAAEAIAALRGARRGATRLQLADHGLRRPPDGRLVGDRRAPDASLRADGDPLRGFSAPRSAASTSTSGACPPADGGPRLQRDPQARSPAPCARRELALLVREDSGLASSRTVIFQRVTRARRWRRTSPTSITSAASRGRSAAPGASRTTPTSGGRPHSSRPGNDRGARHRHPVRPQTRGRDRGPGPLRPVLRRGGARPGGHALPRGAGRGQLPGDSPWPRRDAARPRR